VTNPLLSTPAPVLLWNPMTNDDVPLLLPPFLFLDLCRSPIMSQGFIPASLNHEPLDRTRSPPPSSFSLSVFPMRLSLRFSYCQLPARSSPPPLFRFFSASSLLRPGSRRPSQFYLLKKVGPSLLLRCSSLIDALARSSCGTKSRRP